MTSEAKIVALPTARQRAQRQTLTEAKVRNALPRAERYEITDAEIPGLALRVGSDAKVYILRSRLGTGRKAKRVQIKIGDTRTTTLKQARDLARQHISDLRSGTDPRSVKAGEIRTADLLDRYERDLIARQIVRTIDMMQSLRSNLHPHRTRPIGDLSRLDLTTIIDSITQSGRPGAADYFRKNATGFLNFAADKGHIHISPLAGYRKPRTSRAQQHAGEMWTMTTGEQLQRFLEALSASPNPIFRAYLEFALLTGQRRNEIAHMRWDELNTAGDTWTVPAPRTKMGRTHTVPLGPRSQALLRELAETSNAVPGKTSALVFPSLRKPDTPMSGWTKLLKPVRDAYDHMALAPHGLRRSYRTGLSEIGVPEDIAELNIGHTRAGLAGRYDKSELMPRRLEAQNLWERYIATLAPTD